MTGVAGLARLRRWLGRAHERVVRLCAAFVEVAEQRLKRIGERRRTFEADHAQRTGDLMGVVAREAHGIGEIAVRAVGLDTPERGLEGCVDVRAHPVQGAGVVIE